MTRNRSRRGRGRRPDDAASTQNPSQGAPAESPAVSAPPAQSAEPARATPPATGEAPAQRGQSAASASGAPTSDLPAGSGRNARRRGNRRRGSGGGASAGSGTASLDAARSSDAQMQPPSSPQQPSERQSGRTRPDRARSSERGGDRAQPGARAGDGPPSERRQGGGPQGQSGKRRRGQRRRQGAVTPEVIPTEVLKPTIALPEPLVPMTMRSLEDLGTDTTVSLGCPMLTRTKVALPSAGGLRAPRCNLGWAIHNEDEVAFCLQTPSIAQCWKAHPERLAELMGTPVVDDEASAAD